MHINLNVEKLCKIRKKTEGYEQSLKLERKKLLHFKKQNKERYMVPEHTLSVEKLLKKNQKARVALLYQ